MSSKEDPPANVSSDATSMVAEEFPTVTIVNASDAAGILRQSKMWWVTLVCLLLAGWLAWQSLPERGPEIQVTFPEGHGLKTGDVVRYRGIEVGTVTNVDLTSDLTGIAVDVMLKPGEGNLDREGTRFWIVRPRLSLTEVSGLETAVGAKYIGVSPGDPSGPHQQQFTGLHVAPPDELAGGGLELILRTNDRHGISTGSPITWRGVDVGQVLSVNLSPDARHVDVSVRIDRRYRRLVRPSSKFWITSGFGMDLSLTGLKLNAQSLSTIVRGGISFITPADGAESDIQSGHVFTLAEMPEDDWLDAAATVPFVDIDLPETVTVHGTRTTSILGIQRNRPFTQTGILVGNSGAVHLLTATLPTSATDESQDAMLTEFQIQRADGSTEEYSDIPLADTTASIVGTMLVPCDNQESRLVDKDFRVPTSPEECLIVRSAIVNGKASPVIQAVDIEQLEDREDSWVIFGNDADFTQWHGAPVVASADGKIIGLLLTDSGVPVIAKYQSIEIRE